MQIRFSDEKPEGLGVLVVPVFDGCELGAGGAALDRELGGLISARILAKDNFYAKFGQPLRLSVDPAYGVQDIVLMGMGKPADMTSDRARQLAGSVKKALTQIGENTAGILADTVEGVPASAEEWAAHLADAMVASSYSFDKYKTQANDNKNSLDVHMIASDAGRAEALYAPLKAITDSANWARDLGNEPPNVLTPANYAKRIENEFRAIPNMRVTTLDLDDITALEMGGVLAVSQGSTRNPPRVVVMEYDGTNGSQDRPLALVGKGVTFDTGGYNLKPGNSMADMKTDMCGSAAVVGAMRAMAQNGAKAKVVAIVGLAENMVDGNAYHPSDIITMMNGSTVEIGNTDAEGRLVLADCMTYIQREYDPHTVVELSTLTGAMVVALGDVYTGLFSNNNDLRQKLEQAGKEVGEELWHMPVLHTAFNDAVKGRLADLSNTGMMNGAGASTAAAFLHAFVEPAKDGSTRGWAHMDIAGTSRKGSGATGVGARLLTRFVENEIAERDLDLAIRVVPDVAPDAAQG